MFKKMAESARSVVEIRKNLESKAGNSGTAVSSV
jgi:hypothetical protein